MKSKKWSALLSLAIAFVLWYYVISVVSPGSTETIYDIPVVFEGETVLGTERNLIVTDISTTTVNMKISGNRSELNKINSSNIIVKVDMSKIYDPGDTQLSYTHSFPGDVSQNALTVENKFPGTITVTTDTKLTNKVPVRLVYSGSAPEGFITDTENAVLDPSYVTVTGPSSVVNLIDHARIDVDLSAQNQTISDYLVYTLCDVDGKPVDAEQIVTDVGEIYMNLTIHRFREAQLVLNVTYGGGADESNTKITMTPQSIRVSGSEKVLETLNELTVGSVDLSTVETNTVLTFPIVLPDGVTNLSGVTDATASITFDNLATKKFTVNNIQVINVPEGMEYDLMNEALEVTLRGNAVLIGTLDPEDISIVVDLSGKEAGTFTVKATIVIGNNNYVSIGEMGTHSVSVTLTAAEAD